MENSTLTVSTLINNFVINAIFDINITVIVNVFLYSAAITFGVSVSIKVVKEIINFIYYKWTSGYERRAEEIKELNRKMHDRLVELEEAIESKRKPEDYVKVRTRLRYNASRLKKYDKTISEDVKNLLKVSLTNDSAGINYEMITNVNKLIEQIGEKVDKLWIK